MPKTKIVLALAVLVLAGSAVLLGHRFFQPKAPAATAVSAPPVSVVALDLPDAVAQGGIRAEFTGNGKEKLTLTVHNNGAQPLRLHLAAGQVFNSDASTIALARSCDLEIQPKARRVENLRTVALNSTNQIGEQTFALSAVKPTFDLLFACFDLHPELSLPAAQVAALVLSENLPLSAFARFSVPNGGIASRLDTKAFKTDTCDIISALVALRNARLDEQIALKVDPQLKIEAMIDPLAHGLALHYYNIGEEWAYWKNELLQGAPATRHYALYGIARFYPDVAIQMLPKWARTTQTTPVFRTSAIQALAETQKPEALKILRQLELELGTASEFGKVAQTAADYLDGKFSAQAAPRAAISFRTDPGLSLKKPALARTN